MNILEAICAFVFFVCLFTNALGVLLDEFKQTGHNQAPSVYIAEITIPIVIADLSVLAVDIIARIAFQEVKMREEETTSESIKELIEFMNTMRKEKVTWITEKGIYELDYNYNPPRVTRIKDENERDKVQSMVERYKTLSRLR